MDSSKFTEQLVQYSQVEQQIETNSKLGDLTDTLTKQIQATSAGAALAYIGKTAMFNSDAAALQDGAAAWNYALESATASTVLTVTDANGKTVYETTGEQTAGAHQFTWDGKNANGDTVPDGVYHLKVTAVDAAGKAINSAVSVTETITGVDMSGTDAAVMTAAGTRGFTSILKIGG
jgi:flagellar basal-body rod modification protein FlgD